jgi:hypothetical protein
MRGLKTVLKTGALGAVVAIGALAVTTTSASAYIACNRWHDCWKVPTRVAYPANVGVSWYPDTWVGYRGSGYHWNATVPAGRGYYYRGRWRRW